jgi:hypothetical protein
MKYIISLVLTVLAFTINCFSQQIPEDISSTLAKLKAETKNILDNFRIKQQSQGLYIGLIQHALPDEQFKRAVLLNLKLDLGMIYDDDMRNRLLQLLKNEYRPDELDTLVERGLAVALEANERLALDICKFDTMRLFKNSLDSFFNEIKNKQSNNRGYAYFYKYNVFKLLKLDTTIKFKEVLNNIRIKDRASYIHDLKNNNQDLSIIAELCGYIKDQRFIQPLIEALNKPNNFSRQVVIESLSRMKIEPYYSNLLKENTHTMAEIQAGIYMDYRLFTEVLRSQDSFLELSKYLKSNTECLIVADEDISHRRHGDELKFCILQSIYNNLENPDMKILVGNGTDKIYIPYNVSPEIETAVDKLYNWMQKNHGNYKITWFHY